ncbi:hypothetical protein DL765_002002 [Monosporascus sp. GIB2]|nr:hypothetical protein DL765_002002 [Monosporascus sp. GIB2]
MQSLRAADSNASLNTAWTQRTSQDLDLHTPGHGEEHKVTDDANKQYLTGFRLVINMICVVLASFLVLLDNSVVSTAIPEITDEFHSLEDIGWYGSAYTLGNACLQLLTGKVYQYFSLKWSWLSFFALFEIGSAVCGAAQSSSMLIIGRVVAGAGSAGLISGAFTIISACVPVEKRPPLLGMMMGITQLGNIVGPIIGGAFTTGYTWRWCFYINLPVGALVVVPILFLHIPEQIAKDNFWTVLPKLNHHLDLVGFLLFAPAVTQLLLALQFGGNQFAWNSSQVIGLFCGAATNLVVWVAWDYYKKDDALLPVSLVRRRAIWAGALYHAFLMSTLFGAVYYLPIYFQGINGMSAVMSGVSLLPTILPQMVVAIGSGFLVTRVGFVPPFAMLAGALTSIANGLFSTLGPGNSFGSRIGFQIIMGAGLGFGVQMALVATQSSVSPQEISTATALIFWAQSMGPTIFLPLYNTIFNTSLNSQLRRQAPQVDAKAILDAGAAMFREMVSPQDLPSVLEAYSDSIESVFYLVAAAGALAFFAACGMSWRDIRKKNSTAPVQARDSEIELQVLIE